MKIKIKIILLVLLLLQLGVGFAQTDSIKLVKYNSSFRFADGLYVSHSHLLKNNPIPKNRILSKYNKSDFDFFDKLLSEKTVVYYDAYGLQKQIQTVKLWGFCNRGAIFVNWGDSFNRIPVVGSLCHFVASVTTYDDRYYNPSYGYSYYNTMPVTRTKTEVFQFVLDFDTGKIMEYTTSNILVLLMKDPELYDEFNALKKKKQRNMKFLYLRKYNEKHPLYIPIK